MRVAHVTLAVNNQHAFNFLNCDALQKSRDNVTYKNLYLIYHPFSPEFSNCQQIIEIEQKRVRYKQLTIYQTDDLHTFCSLKFSGISTPTISRWSEYIKTSDDNRSHTETMLYTLKDLPTR